MISIISEFDNSLSFGETWDIDKTSKDMIMSGETGAPPAG